MRKRLSGRRSRSTLRHQPVLRRDSEYPAGASGPVLTICVGIWLNIRTVRCGMCRFQPCPCTVERLPETWHATTNGYLKSGGKLTFAMRRERCKYSRGLRPRCIGQKRGTIAGDDPRAISPSESREHAACVPVRLPPNARVSMIEQTRPGRAIQWPKVDDTEAVCACWSGHLTGVFVGAGARDSRHRSPVYCGSTIFFWVAPFRRRVRPMSGEVTHRARRQSMEKFTRRLKGIYVRGIWDRSQHGARSRLTT